MNLPGEIEIENRPSTEAKALRINLNSLIYGTFAEIGAGQEVARQFFRIGGASGTIAKTISAYDKNFSDTSYSEEEDRRYVTETRLHKMLAYEIFTFDRIFAAIVNGPTKDKFINLVADHANKAIDDAVGLSKPLINLVAGKRNFERMKNIVVEKIYNN